MTNSVHTISALRIPQTELDALQARLAAIRWPNVIDESDTQHGIALSRVRALVDRWQHHFDWRAVEKQLDALGQRLISGPGGRQLHVLHARSPRPSGLPVLLLHGWPDSPLRFVRIIPLLLAAGHDVVAPATPGFGWSEQPGEEMSAAQVAEDFAWLMTELGYQRYAAHGGDQGSTIATALAEGHPEAVAALHLTDVPWDRTFAVDQAEASSPEQVFLRAAQTWGAEQTYLLANTRNPDTVSTALSDSPVGLLAWIAEMYQTWSEDPIPDDDVLAVVSLLWLTNTVRSSIRLYSEPASAWGDADAEDGDTMGDDWSLTRVEVPTGFALFPRDLAGIPPREFAERFYAVERFTVMPRGGHFAALEQPELLADDLVGFLAGR